MFKFNNTHIFTGYLKQLLSSINLPMCKIYTKDFLRYLQIHGVEDPRVIESLSTTANKRLATKVNYLKNNELFNYFLDNSKGRWSKIPNKFYSIDVNTAGLTTTLDSPGIVYDTVTHEYLGDFLRFLRDFYDVNLMSMYNCFNNKICNNLYYYFDLAIKNPEFNPNLDADDDTNPTHVYARRVFDSADSKYKIYAIPVKLFSEYTIAVDSSKGIELFCGFYNTTLDTSELAKDLINKTYQKENKTIFKQPILYTKLNVTNWNREADDVALPDVNSLTRWDIINREKDLRLFIKIPAECNSSVTVLEGNFLHYNDAKYEIQNNDTTNQELWRYSQNHTILNFGSRNDKLDQNETAFKPISKLQLLEINTGESYPFATRLVEYLSGSAITPLDPIHDNIKRAQAVMKNNNHYFKIEGLWENKMQKIIYDYIMNAGTITKEVIKPQTDQNITYSSGTRNTPINNQTHTVYTDKSRGSGYYKKLGFTNRSTLYDVLGYVDRDAEKWYASYKKEGTKNRLVDNIHSVDIYNKLYDL